MITLYWDWKNDKNFSFGGDSFVREDQFETTCNEVGKINKVVVLKHDAVPIIFIHRKYRAPPWSSGSVLDHRSLPPVFASRRGHIWRLFHLWLRLITFVGRAAHLAYHVHKSGRKTSIIIIIHRKYYIANSSRHTASISGKIRVRVL